MTPTIDTWNLLKSVYTLQYTLTYEMSTSSAQDMIGGLKVTTRSSTGDIQYHSSPTIWDKDILWSH